MKTEKTSTPHSRGLARSQIDLLSWAMSYDKAVKGLTHDFYRYPARFSPQFAGAAIEAFTDKGDLVLDPFMGGGTTLVEARARGRFSIGTDINELAVFVSKVKTTAISNSDAQTILAWCKCINEILRLNHRSQAERLDHDDYYLRNLSTRTTWRIRDLIQLGLQSLSDLNNAKQRKLVQCALLATGQWALDCRIDVPSVQEFRDQFAERITLMVGGAVEYARTVRSQDRKVKSSLPRRTLCLNQTAASISRSKIIQKYPRPRLILTSPPYPGVHVLYHRWQIMGRRETPAPYWISQSHDGTGGSYYTFGDRKQTQLKNYFRIAEQSFMSLRRLCSDGTTVVQLIAFPDIEWQLPRYMEMMETAGFKSYSFPCSCGNRNCAITREVPNRKWYAAQKGNTSSSRELLLVHYPR